MIPLEDEPQELPSTTATATTVNVESRRQPGIIYLSSIPPYMNVTRIREVFGKYGTIGRVYLQLAHTEPRPGEKKSKKRNVAMKFTEGWVEFESKSLARRVAEELNNKQVSTRKKSKQYDSVWNMRYLSTFKWTHLHERLAYEKAARKHKLRAEVELAKKKTNFFTINLDKGKKKTPFVNKELPVAQEPMQLGEVAEDNGGRNDFLKTLFS